MTNVVPSRYDVHTSSDAEVQFGAVQRPVFGEPEPEPWVRCSSGSDD